MKTQLTTYHRLTQGLRKPLRNPHEPCPLITTRWPNQTLLPLDNQPFMTTTCTLTTTPLCTPKGLTQAPATFKGARQPLREGLRKAHGGYQGTGVVRAVCTPSVALKAVFGSHVRPHAAGARVHVHPLQRPKGRREACVSLTSIPTDTLTPCYYL